MPKTKLIFILSGMIILIFIAGIYSVFGPKRTGKSCLAETKQIGTKPLIHEPVIPRHLFPSQENCEHNTGGKCQRLSEVLSNLQEPVGSPYEGYDWVSYEYVTSELQIGEYLDMIANNSCRRVAEFREDPDPRAEDDEQSERIYFCPQNDFFLIEHFYFNLQDLYVFDQNPCDLNID